MAPAGRSGRKAGRTPETQEGASSTETPPDLHFLGGGGSRPCRGDRVADPTKRPVMASCVSAAYAGRLLTGGPRADRHPRNAWVCPSAWMTSAVTAVLGGNGRPGTGATTSAPWASLSTADALTTEGNDGAALEFVGHLSQVGDREGSLWPGVRSSPDRSRTTEGSAAPLPASSAPKSASADTTTRRHDDTAIGAGTGKNLRVRRGQHVEIRHVHGIVTRLAQGRGNNRGQAGVDQQSHTGSTTGSSRSCIAAAANASAW